ncbi:helix-turn-helix domain-containing protein [Euzebya pacifica]|uniref:helix-turn-helix domain-containing protein n=1 Tax=Euzebya pacifica TaxID=1608957 RepID=UPI0030F63A6C
MTTLSDLRGRATITVPEAGVLLGIGKGLAYDAARAGDIPTIRIGRRLLVPTHHLLRQLGVPLNDEAPGGSSAEGSSSSSTDTSQGVRRGEEA